MAPTPSAEGPKHSRVSALAGLISSAIVLSGVFFFINSACSTSTKSGPEACNASAAVPPGASIGIVVPSDGAIIAGSPNQLTSPVLVQFAATGVRVVPITTCDEAAGHFALRVVANDAPDCGPGTFIEARELTDGGREITLMLAPGAYTLTASFTGGVARDFVGLAAAVRITVSGGAAGGAGAGTPRCL